MSQLLKNIIVGSLVSYLSLAICMPATAQSLDGSANVSDDFHALFYGLSNSKEPLDQPLSARIAFEVVSDRALTKDERDLLLELKRSDIETVAISSPSGKASSIPVATLKGKEIFDYILAKEKFDAAYQWQNGAEGLAFLGIHYHVYPATRNHILKPIVKDLIAADKASNVNNAFGPLRSYLEDYRKDIKTLPRFERAAASLMMYDIVKRLDDRRSEDRKIPGFVYSHFDNYRYRSLLPGDFSQY